VIGACYAGTSLREELTKNRWVHIVWTKQSGTTTRPNTKKHAERAKGLLLPISLPSKAASDGNLDVGPVRGGCSTRKHLGIKSGSGGRFSKDSRRERPPDTQPEDDAPVAGDEPEAAGRAHVGRTVDPGTAANDTATAIITRPRGAVFGGALIVLVVAILGRVGM
jgi:hypothetical protein